MSDCENCRNYELDEETGEYYCIAQLDEDDYEKLISGHYKRCPWFDGDDEYKVVRHQI